MKKSIIIALALLCALAGCTLEQPGRNLHTASSLCEYVNFRFCTDVAAPAYEVAAYRFLDEYRVLGAWERKALAEQYGLVGKIHNFDDNSFRFDGFCDISTGGKTFAEGDWERTYQYSDVLESTGWKCVSEDLWENKSTETSVRYCGKDSAGKDTYSVNFTSKKTDDGGYSAYSTFLSDGAVVVDPLAVREYCDLKYFYWSVTLPENLFFIGDFRIETSRLGKMLDWAELSSDDKYRVSYRTSLD